MVLYIHTMTSKLTCVQFALVYLVEHSEMEEPQQVFVT